MINGFTGKYFFLSNFYNAKVTYNGLTFLNSEAAFHSAKVDPLNFVDREKFTKLNPSEAKQLGRRIKLRPDWEDIKIDVMTEVVRAKFAQNPDLQNKLICTYPEELVEVNTWGDVFWGYVDGVGGKNHLGIILMDLRQELINKINMK